MFSPLSYKGCNISLTQKSIKEKLKTGSSEFYLGLRKSKSATFHPSLDILDICHVKMVPYNNIINSFNSVL